ncbi:choline transport protein [Apiospora arundinis]|uniref:Choline transport protein n=1 Tax=Apiospora arundinis TaxID=335852 RepID=A0ABR2HZV0_9PEZI
MALYNGVNLELPTLEHEFVKVFHEGDGISTDYASFALYNMVSGVSPSRLEKIASIPQDEWEAYSIETQCVRPAQPTTDFAGRSLTDVVAAHVAMDKELEPTDGGAVNAGWHPSIFVVVTNEDIEDHGLMLVYVDNAFASNDEYRRVGENEDEEKEDDHDDNGSEAEGDGFQGLMLRRFFFPPKDMGSIISGIARSDERPSWTHKQYNMDGEYSGDSEKNDAEDEEDSEEE